MLRQFVFFCCAEGSRGAAKAPQRQEKKKVEVRVPPALCVFIVLGFMYMLYMSWHYSFVVFQYKTPFEKGLYIL